MVKCDQKNRPKEIDVEQCRNCIHISGKKRWCCRFGLWVDGRSPDGVQRIVRPNKKIIKPPTLAQMASNFSSAMVRWAKKGFKTVSQEVYMKRIKICSKCHGGWRCPHCGCFIKAKAALLTEKCPEGKW